MFFNQMSFRSNDVLIKCRLIKCRSINCQITKKYTNRNKNNSKTLQFTDCCTLQYTDIIKNNLNTYYSLQTEFCKLFKITDIVIYKK